MAPASSSSSSADSAAACVYGMMPCSMTVTGNLFLVAVLGVILAFGLHHRQSAAAGARSNRRAQQNKTRTAAKTIADGSDLLLEVLHPGVIGGFVIPLLGALPDALIILVSGIGEDVKEEIVCRSTTTTAQ